MSEESGSDLGRTTATSPTDDTQAEIARLRAERDAAVADLRRDERRAERRGTTRRVFAGIFVVLFAVLLPITVTATWAHRTVLNTSAYVDTVAPIASDPAVVDALSRQVTDQLYQALNPQEIIAGALPPKAAFLAGPIANGAKDNVREAVNKVLSSSQFQTLWVEANRFAHAQLVSVLRGDSKVLLTTGNQVVLNLVPLLNEALKGASGFVSGVVGKQVTLPTITGNELPSGACQKISAALDRPVPETCGQIPLFKAANLSNAQRAVRAFDRAVLALLIITPLLAIGALWVSKRRRRTLLQLTIGGAVGLVVVRRLVMWEQGRLIETGRPENKAARTAIVDGVLNGFFDITVWLLVGLLVIAAVALVTGPYRWAVRSRTFVATAARKTAVVTVAAVRGTVGKAQDESTIAWVRGHFDVLRITGVIVGLVLLLWLDLNFWGVLVILALVALYEVGLYRLRPPVSITLPPPPPQSQASPPPPPRTTG